MKKKLVAFIFVWAVAIPAVAGGVVMLLWNFLMPDVAGFPLIGFWQAAGLFLLCQVLSGGFVFCLLLLMAGVHSIFHHRNHKAMERWKNLTDEQRREIFRRRMSRFGYREHPYAPVDQQTDEKSGKRTDGDGDDE